jgi:hypothetical protein
MDYSARATTKDAARIRRRRSCTPPRLSSTPPYELEKWSGRLDSNQRPPCAQVPRPAIVRGFVQQAKLRVINLQVDLAL